MPQLGESIAEGTIIRWIKKVGDRVERDEPLFEISTDKVDAEIPAPAAGVLAEIRAREGDTVPVESVVAVIGQPGEAGLGDRQRRSAEATPAPGRRVSTGSPRRELADQDWPDQSAREGTAESVGTPESVAQPFRAGADESLSQRLSPVVRRLAREHKLDVGALVGTGIGGRVTRQDVMRYLESRSQNVRVSTSASPPELVEGRASPGSARQRVEGREVRPPSRGEPIVFGTGETTKSVPMSLMRRKIAEHMVASRRTSAHVHTLFEVDFSEVMRIRDGARADAERSSGRLSMLAFIAKAAVETLRDMPILNASVQGDQIVYQRDINLGIAVALDWGLIVPVVRQADAKSVSQLAAAIADLAERARAKRLNVNEVEGGTFTITNPGVFGSLLGLPIINHPQVAILCVGAIEKRAVVVDDQVVGRPRGYLTLGFDHRLIDGAVADQFMSQVKTRLEQFDSALV